MDKLFKVEVISQTPNPQQAAWAAMRQDYCSEGVTTFRSQWPNEEQAGEYVVKHCLNGGRGHWGVTEHNSIVLNALNFPHDTAMQLRTHRCGISFDVMSQRYTSEGVEAVAMGRTSPEDIFYFRPVGEYRDRQGKQYNYSQRMRETDKGYCIQSCVRYVRQITEYGLSEEHARHNLPQNIRQHFVVSMNMRAVCHILDLRWKADAQLEVRQFCDLLWPHFEAWAPAIANYYKDKRAQKAKLAP